MFLPTDKAEEFLKLVRKETGYTYDILVKILHQKKAVAFRSGSNLRIAVKNGKFSVEWGNVIASVAAKSDEAIAKRLRERLTSYF